MEGANDDARPRPSAARGEKEKAPAPPPPPPPISGELNGGHRRGQRRPRCRRVSLRALAILMMAAAAYLIVAEDFLAQPLSPSAAAPWIFMAFVLWIMGKGLLILSFMN